MKLPKLGTTATTMQQMPMAESAKVKKSVE